MKKFLVFIFKDDYDGIVEYAAVIPDLNFVASFGDSIDEVLINVKEAANLYLEDIDNYPVPRSKKEILEVEEDSTLKDFYTIKEIEFK